MTTRRQFIKNSTKASAAVYLGAIGFSAKSYGRILGANEKVNLGIVGFSDRFRSSLFPSFKNHYKELNFDIIAVSDIWKLRREEGKEFLKKQLDHDIATCINNDELYKTVKNAAGEVLGSENVEETELRMGAEDFGYYAQQIPACFYRVGVMNKEKGIVAGVHTPPFNIDENAIEVGMGLMAWLGTCV